MSDKLLISIVSAEREVFQGEATSILLPGMMGDFMVLLNHGDCISSLRPGFLEVETGKNEKNRFFISGGIIEVLNNEVSILVDSSSSEEEVDSTMISEYIKELEDKLDSETITNRDDLELRRNDFHEAMKSLQK